MVIPKGCTYHFAFLELRYIFFQNKLTLGLNLGLLPDRMLRENLVRSAKSGVMENVRIAFEHIPDGWSQLRETCLPFLLLLLLKTCGIL
jgi:hypothetical protein